MLVERARSMHSDWAWDFYTPIVSQDTKPTVENSAALMISGWERMYNLTQSDTRARTHRENLLKLPV